MYVGSGQGEHDPGIRGNHPGPCMQPEEAAVLGKMVPGAPEVPGAVAKVGIYLLMALTVLPIPVEVEVAVGCTPMG